jgi:hypothetical protein
LVYQGDLIIVVQGTDRVIYTNRIHLDTEQSFGWIPVPFSQTNSPPAVVVYKNTTYLIVRSLDNSVSIKRTTDLNNPWAWEDWTTLSNGIMTVDSPTAAFIGETLSVFIRGQDNKIYLNRTNLTTGLSSGWAQSPSGMTTPDAPAVVRSGNELILVVRGLGNGIFANRMDITTNLWKGWQNLPGATPGRPSLNVIGG